MDDDDQIPLSTKTGDDGTTGLLFGGRVSKTDPVIEVVGTIDEAVATLGMARSLLADGELAGFVLGLQRGLFVVAADVAALPRARNQLRPGISLVTGEMTAVVEASIERLLDERPLRPAFVVPGENPSSAALDVARTRLRTAERRLVAAREAGTDVSDAVLSYVNRASDLVYVLARAAAGPDEEELSHGAVVEGGVADGRRPAAGEPEDDDSEAMR